MLGFFLSGSYLNVQDDDPSYLGDYRVKKDVRDRLLSDPLRLIPVGQDQAVVYNSDYLRADDIEHLDTRQNAAKTTYLASGKIDITTTPTINLTVGGSFEYADRQKFNRANSLLNAENNTRRRDITWRGFVKFTQRFNSREGQAGEENKSKIKNAYYTLQVDYSHYNQLIEDEVHGDKFFDYGYLGKFTTYRAPTYQFVDSLGAFVHTGFRDTLVTFVPSETNADVAAITSQYFNLYPYQPFDVQGLFGIQTEPGPYENLNEITRLNGLLNGERPRRLYDLWNNIGFLDDPDGGEYYKRQTDQFRLTAFGSADIGQHALSIGVEYEQITDRRYELVPIGLWGRANELANFHLQELNNASLDNASISFLELGGQSVALYTYDRLVGTDQPFFDRQLRTSLGLNPDGADIIDVFSLDPSQLDISMFSAEELINDGNSYVTFNGYDHKGNKVDRSTFDDFFDAKDEFGNYTRIQPAFQPIYIAGYVMDKFAFDDIIFNLGVRVDRYDANQNVLKDKFLWRPAYTAGSPEAQALLSEGHPDNIGDDYVVYVDRLVDPSRIVGYRDGETWYDANGQELADPSVLRSSEGIAPYLVGYDDDQNGDLTGSSLKKSAFEDYTPAVNVMPRVAFSFPISDEALFFAHYDVLTQRPTSASRLDLPGYAYIQNTGNILTNPALKPSKTIDYELGFQQVLSKSSSLKLSAFYRELRDMIAIRNVAEAWPLSYRTYDNIDFGTVKGLTATFDLRRTGNVWMRASYTLQFADGTGSDPNTSLALINANQPNLRTISSLDFDQRHRIQVTMDFRYGEGKDYNGPMLFGKPILQRTGLNVVAILGSGTPYSQSSTIYQEASIDSHNGNHRLDGSINGSRLPWQFTTDAQLDRDITLHFGKDQEGQKAKTSNLNIYLLVTNLFNTRNVTDVYRATGSPDNDGYLASAQFQNNIQLQTDEASYRDLYAIKVNNPGNFGQPRTIRLGLRLDF
ncbi:MAG: hypothetical protein H6597_00160 [Flavobacteriales bacterium]|nr:hypothetical protein [Flavobacteriales bacterium]